MLFLKVCLGLAAISAFGAPLDSGWVAYEKGFQPIPGAGKSGGTARFCENGSAEEKRGALNTVSLNQKTASPVMISAWSRSEDVSGAPDDDYSLYLDVAYMDGDHLWGTISPYSCGTHGWQQRRIRFFPSKPVKDLLVYTLLRGHSGKAWFSDVSVTDLSGGSSFDLQAVAPPTSLSKGHWFIRDVKGNSKLVPALDSSRLGLRVEAGKNGVRVFDLRGEDRALTLYYCERVDGAGGRWWNSIRRSMPIGSAECANVTSISSGANGLTSLYPFAAITTPSAGYMLAVPPSIGPRIVRLFYDPASKLLCAAFDVALTKLHPGEAGAEVMTASIDPRWGFRDAARRYYQAFPEAFRNRMPKEGIWIPFTDPSKIEHPKDFGIAVHEGDNSVRSDDRLGILSFRYTEPMTWWMNMAPAVPRTYDAAVGLLEKSLSSSQAQAVVSSGTYGADGRYNVSFANEPWANGAVWVLNPNPALARTGGNALQADVVFDQARAAARYASSPLCGEYLDSLEDHGEVLDYRKESLAASSFPPSFDDDGRPLIPQGYSTYEIARSMSEWLHARGKLLMANSTPRQSWAYMPLMDTAGIEVNWMDGGAWSPDSDDIFCYRRTMSYHKPYMLLQNTDFSKFGSREVGLYFKKCLFYGVYPSFFSADAASNPYWENPSLYNRDRALFKATIPLIRRISLAGWEPVTRARTSDEEVLIERYGSSIWTLFNASSSAKTFRVVFDGIGGKAKDLASGEVLDVGKAMTLVPGDCRVVQLAKD